MVTYLHSIPSALLGVEETIIHERQSNDSQYIYKTCSTFKGEDLFVKSTSFFMETTWNLNLNHQAVHNVGSLSAYIIEFINLFVDFIHSLKNT